MNDGLQFVYAFFEPKQYTMYCLTFVYNLLVLAIDASSVDIIKSLSVTNDMLNITAGDSILDQSLVDFLKNVDDSNPDPEDIAICLDLPLVKYLSITEGNAEAAIQTLSNSISPTNPRVTVFAKYQSKAINQICLASNIVVLNWEVEDDQELPPPLLGFLSSDVISKDFVGLSCTVEAFTQ
ncbi:hypothetical protein GEMRC1_011550 [Eukaryota sp. GEM-RC1]